MSAQHTPGPWYVDDHSGPGAPLVRREDGHPICLLETVRVGGDLRPIANARLVAAAPDLLALAKQYASECGECDGRGSVNAYEEDSTVLDVQEDCPACEDIRAVIAKAEGRS